MQRNHGNEDLYFAYGSNLNDADWRRFCARRNVEPSAIEPLGCAVLPDFRLSFDYYSSTRHGGALNIRPAVGHIVRGVLYRATAAGWRALDIKEGAPTCYAPVRRTALRPDGSRVEVFTYEVNEARRVAYCQPSDEYRSVVSEGLRAWKLPVAALDAAAENRPARIEIDRIFVYGTLMRDQRNAERITADAIRGSLRVSTAGALFDTGYSFPALSVRADDAGVVFGECLQLDPLPSQLLALDDLEGFGGYDDPAPFFHRTIVEVSTSEGDTLSAWCYTSNRPDLLRRRIDCGCWRTYASTLDRA